VPLTAAKGAGEEIILSWGSADACGRGDTDYTVYEGTLGDFGSHLPVSCEISTATTRNLTPAHDQAYYIVVSSNASWEGSYGRQSDLSERLPSAASCLPQALGSCDTCDNGIIEVGEVCDGGDLGGASCQSLGFDAGTLACGFTCRGYDTSDCYHFGCGNGLLEDGEICEAGELGGASCISEGFHSGILACNGTCTGYDTSGCFLCGDDVCDLGGGEDCLSCPEDCNGEQEGGGGTRYCCGDGDGDNPVDCSDPRCTAEGNVCSMNPALVADGLVLRLESDDGLLADGGSVTAWNDLSGYGNDLTASGGPALSVGVLNGRDVVTFDGVDDLLERTLPLNGLPSADGDRTMFFVVSYDSVGYGGFAYGATNCNEAFGLVVDGAGFLAVQAWCLEDDVISTEPGTGAGWMVQSAVLESNSLSHYKNGGHIDSANQTFNTGSDVLVVGAELDGDPFVEMGVAAVLVYDRALTESERWQVEGYLQDKYLGIGL
jgi:hypothetical protein